jgi:serine/threonine protein kinase
VFVCPECGQSFERRGHCTADGAQLGDGSSDSVLGQTIGNYRVARLIGAGGMGAVYKAVHPGIGSRVAIKVFAHDPARSPALVERFFAEARAVNVIRHEHIVNVIDLAALPDGRPYLVMEYLDGEPLSSLLARHGPLPLGTLAQMSCEVLDALGAAHEKGLVHRDLKPDNLFVTPNGHMKVLDFGIAKLRGEVATPGGATRTGALLGTPHYMSPEQALAHPVDARTDVYAMGVILFEAATGKRPFDADSLYELLRLHIEQRPAPPRALRPDLPPAYETVIVRALEKAPAARFQSAAELARALQDASRFVGQEAWARVSGAQVRSPSLAASGPPPVAFFPTPPQAAAASHPPVHRSAPAGPSFTTWRSPEPRPARPSPLIWLLVALGGMGLVGAAVLATATLLARSGPSPPAPSVPAVPAVPATTHPGFSLPATPNKPGGFAAESFDPWTFFDTAEQLARQEQPDARFVRLDATGLRPGGKIDLTLDPRHSVLYRFRSASLSKPPPGFPENKQYEAKCLVYVNVDANGVRIHMAKWSCDQPFLSKPRCSPAAIWKASEARGAPTGNLVGRFGFWANDAGRGRWLIDIGQRFSQFVPDAC